MADNHKIEKARKVLELGESASIPEIKEAYRKLSLKYHPDKCKEEDKTRCEKKFKKINSANEALIEYCLNYKFSFKEIEEAESRENKEMKDHMKRFYDGWWGEFNL